MSEQPMREASSISSSVDVAVDPATAFKVFTEEVNCWWLQGPINFHDSTRAYEMRIEPKTGAAVYSRFTTWIPATDSSWRPSPNGSPVCASPGKALSTT